ncbi:hypothetical protein FRB90_008779 [Tulasnella sp. 427]|nr:hypothetical protein FRB90_008779 [Tulasnella sp. 427]
MARTMQMYHTGPAVSVKSSKPKAASATSSRAGTPSTLVAQPSANDLKGNYHKDETMLLNISGRHSPVGGLKQTAAGRHETGRTGRRSPAQNHNLVANQKVPPVSKQSTASSSESRFRKERPRRGSPPAITITRPLEITKGPAVSTTNALNLAVPKARQSKPLPVIDPTKLSPVVAKFAEFISASPSSMATADLPVYSDEEGPSVRNFSRPNSRQRVCRTPSFGSRRQGVIGELYHGSSSSDSDSDSISKSLDSVSTAHSGSVDNRSSRYNRLLLAIGL